MLSIMLLHTTGHVHAHVIHVVALVAGVLVLALGYAVKEDTDAR